MKIHNIFISHSWTYGDYYDRLVKMLESEPYFNFKNYSVPKYDPIHNASNTTQLKEAITNQILPCGVILVMAGVYSTYSKWIQEEIKIAKMYPNKKILAIIPWGAENTSQFVKGESHEIIKWLSFVFILDKSLLNNVDISWLFNIIIKLSVSIVFEKL